VGVRSFFLALPRFLSLFFSLKVENESRQSREAPLGCLGSFLSGEIRSTSKQDTHSSRFDEMQPARSRAVSYSWQDDRRHVASEERARVRVWNGRLGAHTAKGETDSQTGEWEGEESAHRSLDLSFSLLTRMESRFRCRASLLDRTSCPTSVRRKSVVAGSPLPFTNDT